MIEYLPVALALLFGFGVGWFVWGRKPRIGRAPAEYVLLEPSSDTTETILGTTGIHGPSPFRVVTLDGKVRYDGASGAEARRCIELLRIERAEWCAYRDGVRWDSSS